MKVLGKLLTGIILVLAFQTSSQAQCETWNDSSRKTEAENAHVIYRPFVKNKTSEDLAKLSSEDFEIAFSNWKSAYDISPAADGQRPFHFIDGRLFYKSLRLKTEDAALKKEYAEIIMNLYDQEMQCFSKNEGYLLGRKGFDMFYMPEYGYRMETYETLQKGLVVGGNNTEYIVFEPLTQAMVYLYQQDKVTREDVIKNVELMEAVITHNEENNERYGEYYKASGARMNSFLAPIEDEVFDCTFFKNKLLPQYEENPDDLEVIRYVYNKLRQQGCDSTDTDLAAIQTAYETKAAAINAGLEADRRKNNAAYDAVQLQKEGKYAESVERYKEAIAETDDASAKCQFYYSIGFIQTWQLNNVQAGKSNALKARELCSDWGKPLLLIGDIYAKLSRNCGDDWEKRLAILAAMEKYARAKAVDPDVKEEADKKYSAFYSSRPTNQDAFMRGYKDGQSVRSSCVGETVKLNLQDSN